MLEWLKLKEMIQDLLKVNQERIWEERPQTKVMQTQAPEITETAAEITETAAEITETAAEITQTTKTTKTKIIQKTKNR
jgi:hypothetical protein